MCNHNPLFKANLPHNSDVLVNEYDHGKFVKTRHSKSNLRSKRGLITQCLLCRNPKVLKEAWKQ